MILIFVLFRRHPNLMFIIFNVTPFFLSFFLFFLWDTFFICNKKYTETEPTSSDCPWRNNSVIETCFFLLKQHEYIYSIIKMKNGNNSRTLIYSDIQLLNLFISFETSNFLRETHCFLTIYCLTLCTLDSKQDNDFNVRQAMTVETQRQSLMSLVISVVSIDEKSGTEDQVKMLLAWEVRQSHSSLFLVCWRTEKSRTFASSSGCTRLKENLTLIIKSSLQKSLVQTKIAKKTRCCITFLIHYKYWITVSRKKYTAALKRDWRIETLH